MPGPQHEAPFARSPITGSIDGRRAVAPPSLPELARLEGGVLAAPKGFFGEFSDERDERVDSRFQERLPNLLPPCAVSLGVVVVLLVFRSSSLSTRPLRELPEMHRAKNDMILLMRPPRRPAGLSCVSAFLGYCSGVEFGRNCGKRSWCLSLRYCS